MGCDIHPQIEWLEYEPRGTDPAWWTVWATGDLGVPRSYSLFAALANVRQYEERGIVEPVAMPRGLPEQPTYEARQSAEDPAQYHSHSWLTLEECEEASRRAIAHGARHGATRSGLEGVIAILRHLKESGHKARFVFWFDN